MIDECGYVGFLQSELVVRQLNGMLESLYCD